MRRGSTRGVAKSQKLLGKKKSVSPNSRRSGRGIIQQPLLASTPSPSSPSLPDTKTSSGYAMEVYFLDSSSIFVDVHEDTTVHDMIAAIVSRLAIPTGTWSNTATAVIGLFGWNGDNLKSYAARSKTLSISTLTSNNNNNGHGNNSAVQFQNPTRAPLRKYGSIMPRLIPLRPHEKRASLPSLGVPLYDTENIHDVMEEGQYTGLVCTFKVSMRESNAPRDLWKTQAMLRLRFLHEQSLVRVGTYNQLNLKQAKYLAALILCCELGSAEADRDMPVSDMFERLVTALLPGYLTLGTELPESEDTLKSKKRRHKLALAVWKEFQRMTLAESGLSLQDTVMRRYLRFLEEEAGSARYGATFYSVYNSAGGSSPRKRQRKSVFSRSSSSSSRGRGKPCWLGVHEEGVFLMNDMRNKVKWTFPRRAIRDWSVGASGHSFSFSLDPDDLHVQSLNLNSHTFGFSSVVAVDVCEQLSRYALASSVCRTASRPNSRQRSHSRRIQSMSHMRGTSGAGMFMALPPSSPIAQAARKTQAHARAHTSLASPLSSGTSQFSSPSQQSRSFEQNKSISEQKMNKGRTSTSPSSPSARRDFQKLITVEMARPRSEEFATPIASAATVAAELLGFSMLHPLLRRKGLRSLFLPDGKGEKTFHSMVDEVQAASILTLWWRIKSTFRRMNRHALQANEEGGQGDAPGEVNGADAEDVADNKMSKMMALWLSFVKLKATHKQVRESRAARTLQLAWYRFQIRCIWRALLRDGLRIQSSNLKLDLRLGTSSPINTVSSLPFVGTGGQSGGGHQANRIMTSKFRRMSSHRRHSTRHRRRSSGPLVNARELKMVASLTAAKMRLSPIVIPICNRTSSMPSPSPGSNHVGIKVGPELVTFLRGIPLFHALDDDETHMLCGRMTARRYKEGQHIVTEGDPAKGEAAEFFIIREGLVEVVKEFEIQPDNTGGEQKASLSGGTVAGRGDGGGGGGGGGGSEAGGVAMEKSTGTKGSRTVARLAAGDCFGERALILEQPRSATCIARAPGGTVCLVIKGSDFVDSIASQANDIVWTDDIEALSIARYAAEYASHLDGVHETHKFDSKMHKPPSLDPREKQIEWLGAKSPLESTAKHLKWLEIDDQLVESSVSAIRERLHRKLLSNISHEVDPSDTIQHVLADIVEELGAVGAMVYFRDTQQLQDFDENKAQSARANGDFAVEESQQSKSMRCISLGRAGVLTVLDGFSFASKALKTRKIIVSSDVYRHASLQRDSEELWQRAMGPASVEITSLISMPVLLTSLGSREESEGNNLEECVVEILNIGGGARNPTSRDISLLHIAASYIDRALRDHRQRFHESIERGLEMSSLITPVSVKLCAADHVESALEAHFGRLSASKRANVRAHVRVEMYHGETCLCKPVSSSPTRLSKDGDTFSWGEDGIWLSLPMTISDLAPAVRVILKLDVDLGSAGGEDDTLAVDEYGGHNTIAWAGYNVLDFERRLKTGLLQLCMWQGACPSPTVPGIENVEGDIETTAVLQIEIASYGQEVFYDDDDFRTVSGTLLEDIEGDMTALTLQEARRIERLLQKDGLHEYPEKDKAFIWEKRLALVDHAPQALPVVLKCADWSKRHQVQGVYALLHIWRPLVPEVALQLLDASQPDPRVRAFAINCLEEALSDKQLSIYLLQLVQAMKGEMYHDSALARFLIRRGLSSISAVGLPLYWSITSELVDSVCSYRFGIFLQNFLKVCGTTNRQRFGHQAFITKRLSFVQEIVKAVKKDDRTRILREQLNKIVFPSSFSLPVAPNKKLTGLNVEKCRVMNSKQVPLWLEFVDEDDFQSKPLLVLLKLGDDLRQDQLTLQLLSVMDMMWKEAGMDLCMSPYGCVSMGDEVGLIEIVPRAKTVSSIIAESAKGTSSALLRSFKAAFSSENSVLDWIVVQANKPKQSAALLQSEVGEENDVSSPPSGSHRSQHRHRRLLTEVDFLSGRSEYNPKEQEHWITFQQQIQGHEQLSNRSSRKKHLVVSKHFKSLALTPQLMRSIDRFMHSLAGYCVATFVLGIGDRHPSNLLMTDSGKFLHIDFGHFLGHFKTKYGFKRETAPFVFTPQFAAVLGGTGSVLYSRFETLCCDAFIELRQRSELLITLFSLMLGSGIPQLQRKKDIIWLRQKLMPSLSEQEARREFRALIETSVKCERTQFNNFCVSYLLPLPSDPALSILVSPRPFPPFFVMVSPFHFTNSCHTHAPFLLFFSTH